MEDLKGPYPVAEATNQANGMGIGGYAADRSRTLDEMLQHLEARIDVAEEGIRGMRCAAVALRDKIRNAVRRKANSLRDELSEMEQFEHRDRR